MLELRQLRYFMMLAETLHFGRAAARLHISQPPLSRQINALEKTLGVELLSRTSRHVVLTPAGRHFQERISQVFALLEATRHSTQAVARGERGSLDIGFTMSAAWNVMPPLTRLFGEIHADIHMNLQEVLPSELNAALESGSLDVGIAFPWLRTEGLEYLRIHSEPLCAVLLADHPLARHATIDVGDLAREAFVTVPEAAAPGLHERVNGCCRDHGFEPRVRFETRLQQTIINFVAEGLGVSLVPASLSKINLPGAIFRPLKKTRMVEQGIIWASVNDNPCLSTFLDCARDFATRCPAEKTAGS